MNVLEYIRQLLNKRIDQHPSDYHIPENWNTWGFQNYRKALGRPGEILVNPCEYLSECIGMILESGHKGKTHEQPELPQQMNPCRNTIYCMLPGTITAWDHHQKNEICSGTFIKAISLLPMLKSFGIDIISLLPVFERSDRYKKGEIGSPYAIKNLYKIDSSLHEPLLGDYTEELMETEFTAFIEACHTMGMKVMMDFPFRTASRDSDLILSHPDWFYWIDISHAQSITPPPIEGVSKPLPVNDETLPKLYASKGLKEYLSAFKVNPEERDGQKWEDLVKRHRETGENLLKLIENEFGMTTLPAFSDVLNDKQPKWTDVTYLRFYYDIHEKADAYVDAHQPPFIMQDGVKLNLYPGKKTNRGLFDYIAQVIPYYQEKYGVDGARLDMGHALPTDLIEVIVSRAKSRNNAFLFWSEEFESEKSHMAKENGFHFITGMAWSLYRDLEKRDFNRRLIRDCLLKSQLPVTAALETPDTPRAAHVYQSKPRLEQLVLMNCFLPNTVSFWNSGLEVLERQPMNLGLDNTEAGRFVLDPKDPMYGRLAFFDPYRLHWTNDEKEWMMKLLKSAAELKKRYLDIISSKEKFIETKKLYRSLKLTFLYYSDRAAGKDVFFLANRSFREKAVFNPSEWLTDQAFSLKTRLIYRNGLLQHSEAIDGSVAVTQEIEGRKNDDFLSVRSVLLPGEVIVGEVIYG